MEGEGHDQRSVWERFYQEQGRPWRGIGKLGDLEVKAGNVALDLGCGNGKTARALIQKGAIVTGIDFSPSAIESCIRQFGDKGRFIECRCEALPFEDNMFDIVTAVHVLEHLDADQLERAVEEMFRVMRVGGMLFVRMFAVGDMRSNGDNVSERGNGIVYRYRDTGEIIAIFERFKCISIETIDESTRFGAVRIRNECIFEKT